MEKKYYRVKPVMKPVTEQEFFEFVKNYPRPLDRDVAGMSSPPALSYNDFQLADKWPYSIVASGFLYSNDPGDYYYEPLEDRKYMIMENYEEVFNSKI